MTLLCVPILVPGFQKAITDAQEARLLGAELVEFRVDHVFHGEDDAEGAALVQRLVNESPLPCIVTCRPTFEGGDYDGDDASRISLYESLGCASAPDHPPRYIDVELQTLQRSANLKQKVHLAVDHPAQLRDLATSLILSHHDFNGRPASLHKALSEMRMEPAAKVLKIAYRARSLRDNIELFEMLLERDRPMIALAMGEFGLMSRVLAPKFGGFLTFASLRDTSTTAPGQPTVRELVDLYRFRSINSSTAVYGVIGWPVAHSRSPQLHNAGFEAVGHNGVYLPLPIPAEWEHFKATLASLLDFPPLSFRGASVTIPHKEHLLRFAREDTSRKWIIDPLAERAGAANTLVVRNDGSCAALNTDIPAVVLPLRQSLGNLTGMRVGIVGAGGVARAAAVGLLDAGANVVIHNRTSERAQTLVEELRRSTGAGSDRLATAPLSSLATSGTHALVNATPVGMTGGPEPEGTPIPNDILRQLAAASERSPAVVMDTVYTPRETPLIKQSRVLGVTAITGDEMFLHQAAAQFEAWTGSRAPVTLFRRVLDETLASAGYPHPNSEE